jgi:hypothetical protein
LIFLAVPLFITVLLRKLKGQITIPDPAIAAKIPVKPRTAARDLTPTAPDPPPKHERSPNEPIVPNAANELLRSAPNDEPGRAVSEPPQDREGAPMKGLTHLDFDGRDAMTLRYWFDWWRAPARRQDGEEEAGRRPDVEAAKVYAELEARYKAGHLRKPPGGLQEAVRMEIRFLPW